MPLLSPNRITLTLFFSSSKWNFPFALISVFPICVINRPIFDVYAMLIWHCIIHTHMTRVYRVTELPSEWSHTYTRRPSSTRPITHRQHRIIRDQGEPFPSCFPRFLSHSWPSFFFSRHKQARLCFCHLTKLRRGVSVVSDILRRVHHITFVHWSRRANRACCLGLPRSPFFLQNHQRPTSCVEVHEN